MVVEIPAMLHRFFSNSKTFGISNKSVDINSENSLDIQFISQLRGVDPSL